MAVRKIPIKGYFFNNLDKQTHPFPVVLNLQSNSKREY